MSTTDLATGRFLRLRVVDGWEWCERVNASGVVVVVARTPEGKVLLVEQRRPPVGGPVLELPAGLAGDHGDADEAMATAACRELEEETGYTAARMELLTVGPVSAGMTSEVLTWFRAHDLSRIGAGGGDASEDIVVHEVPEAEVHDFIASRVAAGVQIDTKVYAGLYFLGRAR